MLKRIGIVAAAITAVAFTIAPFNGPIIRVSEPDTFQVTYEDDPAFNCALNGNHACGDDGILQMRLWDSWYLNTDVYST